MNPEQTTNADLKKEIRQLRFQLSNTQGILRKFKNKAAEVDKFGQVKNRFVEAVAHEMRTPVTPLKAVIDMFHEGLLGELSPEQYRFIKIMHGNVTRLCHLIGEVTQLHRLESGKTILKAQKVDVSKILSEISEMLKETAHRKNITIETECEKELFVHSDPHAIWTIVNSLVENAIMHNIADINIKISAKSTHDNTVNITVSDNGSGIPEDKLNRIFDGFNRFKGNYGPGYRGLGIGLAICKRLAEKIEAAIFIESELDKGTTVTVSIPRVAPPEGASIIFSK